MTEKKLSYDRNIVAQETGYWCGPASAQIVLSGKGVHVAESELARLIGTHTGGTDYIDLIEKRALDKFLPEADYRSVHLPIDPPTPAQRETFWNHLRSSIDAGYGVVMNWVSPASNPPIGIKGSQSPVGYGRYTIYHYVAAMGYDAYDRAVWVADSGFRPHGYWVSLEQCVVLMAPKGYAYAHNGRPVASPAPKPDTGVDVLSEVMGGSVGRDRYAALLPAVEKCLKDCDALSEPRISMWCAQIGHESGGLKYMEEIADGSQYEGRADLGNTQPGDGKRFKGRGPIQVTGRHNYTALSKWAHGKGLVPTATYFVDHPKELASDKYGFIGVTWYWSTQRPLNQASDEKNLEKATRYINGGLNGLTDRRRRYEKANSMGKRLLVLASRKEDAVSTQFPSLSPYRTPGEGNIGDWCQIDRNVDSMAHQLFVEWSATRIGDPEAIYRVFRSAAGKGADTSKEFVHHAGLVLKQVPEDMLVKVMESVAELEPDLIQAYLRMKK